MEQYLGKTLLLSTLLYSTAMITSANDFSGLYIGIDTNKTLSHPTTSQSVKLNKEVDSTTKCNAPKVRFYLKWCLIP